MKQNWKLNRFTLLELIVGVALATVVLMALFVVFVPQSRHRTSATHTSGINTLKRVSIASPIGAGSHPNSGALP